MNVTKIKPIKLKEETAYLAGVIIGDGHIADCTKSKEDQSRDYRIVLDIADKDYLNLLCKMIKSIVKTESIPKYPKMRGNRKERLYFQFRNKSFFYFLTKSLGIAKGAKSSVVEVPIKIKNSSKEIKKYFLAGLFDTDGGFRGNTLGFTTASKKLNNNVSDLLNEFSIVHSLEEWKNKKYKRSYYGIKIKRSQIDRFLKMFPFQNKEKLVRICKKFNAGVPEWPNGTVYSNQFLG